MNAILQGLHPILTCDEARAFEAAWFGGDEAREWPAMQRAGRALAHAALRDFTEMGEFPEAGRVLVLAGKGHNGGDALLAARVVLDRFPKTRVEVIFAFGERALRPLAQRAWRELAQAGAIRSEALTGAYDLCFDGIFGFQFRAPAEPRIAQMIAGVNAAPIRLRAAVDLPSAGLFRADFTYATGCVKTPVVGAAEAGRVRYLDLGFFGDAARGADPGPGSTSPATSCVLTPSLLAPLAALRPAVGDKRAYGHVFVLAGSRNFPGAALMAVRAALRSGVGLVTAFVPESLVPTFAAVAPEAMWVGWPETPGGGLALEGAHLLRERIERATSLLLGPGVGREPETLALVGALVKEASVPLVIDADALQPAIVGAGRAPRVLTPHAGEYERIVDAIPDEATLVLKGPVTRIGSAAGLSPALGQAKGGRKTRPFAERIIYHSFFGGPVLARGGSGDLLAGLIGGLLAQSPKEPLLAAARGVVWHGLAADGLARTHGQTAVQVTQLLDFLGPVLREEF